MNARSNTTSAPAVPDFPIPFAMQEPSDDLHDALALLELLSTTIDDGMKHGLNKTTVVRMSVAFGMALESIRTVAAYLDADDRDGTVDIYRRARRARISDIYQRGMA